jgi:hypothetical protein
MMEDVHEKIFAELLPLGRLPTKQRSAIGWQEYPSYNSSAAASPELVFQIHLHWLDGVIL